MPNHVSLDPSQKARKNGELVSDDEEESRNESVAR